MGVLLQGADMLLAMTRKAEEAHQQRPDHWREDVDLLANQAKVFGTVLRKVLQEQQQVGDEDEPGQPDGEDQAPCGRQGTLRLPSPVPSLPSTANTTDGCWSSGPTTAASREVYATGNRTLKVRLRVGQDEAPANSSRDSEGQDCDVDMLEHRWVHFRKEEEEEEQEEEEEEDDKKWPISPSYSPPSSPPRNMEEEEEKVPCKFGPPFPTNSPPRAPPPKTDWNWKKEEEEEEEEGLAESHSYSPSGLPPKRKWEWELEEERWDSPSPPPKRRQASDVEGSDAAKTSAIKLWREKLKRHLEKVDKFLEGNNNDKKKKKKNKRKEESKDDGRGWKPQGSRKS